MRRYRTLLSIVLACLLVAIQQVGFAHALSHLGSGGTQNTRPDKQHPAQKVCDECLAYAQIGSALTASAPVLPPAPAVVAPVAVPHGRSAAAPTLHFHSRAPPASYA